MEFKAESGIHISVANGQESPKKDLTVAHPGGDAGVAFDHNNLGPGTSN